MRGNILARLGRYADAAREFRAAEPSRARRPIEFEMYSAFALLGARDMESYREMLATRVDTTQNSKVSSERLIFAWLHALIPEEIEGFAHFVESLKKEAVERKLHPVDDWSAEELDRSRKRVLGAMLYRLGEYDNAVRTLTDLSAQLDQNRDQAGRYYLACTQYFLAMAHHQLGHEFQTRRCLDAACAIDGKLQKVPSLDWTRRVTLNTLRREAKGDD